MADSLRRKTDNDSEELSEELEGESTYIVEKILDKKKFGHQYKYWVKWEGYPHDQNTWEPLENLENVKTMVKEFNKTFKDTQTSSNESTNKTTLPKKKVGPKQKKPMNPQPSLDTKPISEFFPSNKDNAKTTRKQHNADPSKSPQPKKKLRSETGSNTGNDALPSEGGYNHGDKVIKIISAKKTEDDITFFVEWKPRKNGFIPERSFVPNKILKKRDQDILIEFYETKITFKGNNNTSESKDKVEPPSVEKSMTENESYILKLLSSCLGYAISFVDLEYVDDPLKNEIETVMGFKYHKLLRNVHENPKDLIIIHSESFKETRPEFLAYAFKKFPPLFTVSGNCEAIAIVQPKEEKMCLENNEEEKENDNEKKGEHQINEVKDAVKEERNDHECSKLNEILQTALKGFSNIHHLKLSSAENLSFLKNKSVIFIYKQTSIVGQSDLTDEIQKVFKNLAPSKEYALVNIEKPETDKNPQAVLLKSIFLNCFQGKGVIFYCQHSQEQEVWQSWEYIKNVFGIVNLTIGIDITDLDDVNPLSTIPNYLDSKVESTYSVIVANSKGSLETTLLIKKMNRLMSELKPLALFMNINILFE